MTRVLPLPAPARMSTGPSVVSTASRCSGFSWSKKDNADVSSELVVQFYRGMAAEVSKFQVFRISKWQSHNLQ